MPSRRPPSQRDPAFAPLRVASTVRQVLPGVAVKNATPVKTSVGRARMATSLYLEAIVKSGVAAVATNLMPPGFRIPVAATLTSAYVNVGTAPTGSSLTVLVKNAGTTIATISVAAGATSGSSTGLSSALALGDLLTVDISAVGSTVPGSDVLVSLVAA